MIWIEEISDCEANVKGYRGVKHKIDKNELYFICVLAVLIITICILFIYRLSEQKMPVVLLDEFGYWSNGALFAGLDWSGISQYNSYYSYGYGIVLSVLIRIMKNGNYLYQSALFINAVMVFGILFYSYKTIIILYPNLNKIVGLVIAFIIAIYPSNSSNLHIAWDELLLTYLYTCSFYMLVRFIKSSKSRYFILWYLNIFLLYITHQRALGVVLIGIFLVAIFVKARMVSWKQLLLFIIMYMSLFALHRYVKQEILNSVLRNNEMSGTNDYPSIISHVIEWFNIEGLTRVCRCIIGKIGYLIISTCGLFGISVWYVIQKIINSIQKNKMRFLAQDRSIVIELYLSGSLLTTILIASIFTLSNNSRIDGLTYGRYVEWCIGPWILIALGKMCSDKIKKKVVLYNIVVSIIVILAVTNIYYKNQDWEEYAFVCAPVCFVFYRLCRGYNYLLPALQVVISIVAFCSMMHISKRARVRENIISMMGIILFYIVLGKMMIDRVLESNYRSEVVIQMYKEIQMLDDEADVLFIMDDKQTIWYVADLQILAVDKKVYSINEEMINFSEPFFLILDTYSEYGKEISANLSPLVTNWQISMYYIDQLEYDFERRRNE